jgi:hypothetical protein
MRTLWALGVTAALVMPVMCQTSTTTADLAFMAGCWTFDRNGQTIEEHWLAPAGGTLLGVSRTVVGGKTVDFEFLQIRDLPEGLAYIARPSGQAETTFRIASSTAEEIVFENPAHDFPQRIRYRRGKDTLHARIEGTKDGKTRGMDFPYARANCTLF